jgi:hypothetical protein
MNEAGLVPGENARIGQPTGELLMTAPHEGPPPAEQRMSREDIRARFGV